jgi:hypothetical protein
MKPKAPKRDKKLDTAAVLAAWLAVVIAATDAQYERAAEPIPFAYAAE